HGRARKNEALEHDGRRHRRVGAERDGAGAAAGAAAAAPAAEARAEVGPGRERHGGAGGVDGSAGHWAADTVGLAGDRAAAGTGPRHGQGDGRDAERGDPERRVDELGTRPRLPALNPVPDAARAVIAVEVAPEELRKAAAAIAVAPGDRAVVRQVAVLEDGQRQRAVVTAARRVVAVG